MFFVFSKILSFSIQPFTWLLVLLLWAVITKNSQHKKRLLLITISLGFFFGNPTVIGFINRRWEVEPVSDENVSAHKIAIVLGGISYYDTHLKRIHFQRSSDRIFHAIRLYRLGKVEKIFISGGAAYISKKYEKESIFLKEYLLTIGIPDSVICIESESRNTYENACYTKQRMQLAGLYEPAQKYLLITSGYHMRRAQAVFEKQGFLVDTYSVDGSAGAVRWQLDELFIPTVSSFQNWDLLIHEWIGYVTYKLTGKL